MRNRLKALSLILLILASPSAFSAGYLIKQGKGYSICEAVKNQLDKIGSLKQPVHCNQWLAQKIPGLTEPAWQDLDIEKHWDLFVKLHLDDRGTLPQSEEAKRLFDQRMAEWREVAKSGKVKLQMVRANVVFADEAVIRANYKVNFNAGMIDGVVREKVVAGTVVQQEKIVPEGDATETIVRVWQENGCDEMFHSMSINFVTEDLKDIDLAKQRWNVWSAGGDLVMYGGRYYVVRWNEVPSVFRLPKDGVHATSFS